MKKKLKITLERNGGEIKIKVKIPKEIEELYKNQAQGKTRISQVWKDEQGNGLKFYLSGGAVNETGTETETTERRISYIRETDYRYFNDFGQGLIDGNRINLAILRSVGASEGICLKAETSIIGNGNLDLEHYIRELGVYVKELWERSISKQKITAKITFEL